MKNLYFTIISLLFCSGIQSQSFLPIAKDSMQWDVMSRTHFQEVKLTNHYRTRGDTVVHGKQYFKVYVSRNETYQPGGDTLNCLMREDSGKVWVRDRMLYVPLIKPFIYNPSYKIVFDSTEVLLYNFNLQKGDSFNIDDAYCGNYKHYVDTTFDTVYGDGISRKAIVLSLPITGAKHWFLWVGGIGAVYNPLYASRIPITWGSHACIYDWKDVLLCATNAGKFTYHHPEFTDTVCHIDSLLDLYYNYNSIDLLPAEFGISISQTADNLNIICQDITTPILFDIFYIDGRKVASGKLDNQRMEFPIREYSSGPYLIRFFNNQSLSQTNLFIKL